MLLSLSHVTGLALSASAILQPAAGEHHGLNRRQNALNANSVSTAEFKSRFEQSGIVPEIIAALDPAVSFYASYKASGDRDALLVPGSTLTISGMSGIPAGMWGYFATNTAKRRVFRSNSPSRTSTTRRI